MGKDNGASLELVTDKNKFLQLPASVDEIITAMRTYQNLLKQLLTNDDYAVIQDKKCIKKSGWLKLALAFNLSLRIISERKEVDPENSSQFAYHISVECIAGNGRTTVEVGSCDTNEKPTAAEHIIRSMAMTRAKSRAIASMIGASESSAEEMEVVGVEINKNDPPTGKQLDFLKSLGHTGIPPRTKAETSKLIDKLKNNSQEPQDPEKYCTCDKPIPNAITQGRTCQACKKLLYNSS